MTLNFFDQQAARIQEAMKTSELDDEKYMDLFYALQNLCKCAVEFIDARERLAFYEESLDEEPEAKITPLPVKADEPIKEEPKVVTTISLADVKARFTAAAKSGVDVGKIINSAGYSCLSDVDPKDYGSLLKMLNEEES